MGKIKLLDENLINQIAAGEVIERPASIVKELVENSIDAGATKITIDLENDCRNIRIADNGSGIAKDDLELAFTRHATSKISKKEDLWNIQTLGFRGEALSSVISVSKLTCTTKIKDSETGFKAECKDSIVKITETGCSEGTIMEVKDLFFNTPVRLKFLKKSQTEYAHILELMQAIALSHPEIAITVKYKGATGLKTTGSGSIELVLCEIYSKELNKELVVISNTDEEAKMSVSGVASNPSYTRSNKKGIYLFVNGRTVKCPILYKAIDSAYSDLIPNGKYPFLTIELTLAPNDVDVNVHPTKKEVRYTNTNLVYSFVYSSIKNALAHFTPQIKEEDFNFETPSESFSHSSLHSNPSSSRPSYSSYSSFKPTFSQNISTQSYQRNINQRFDDEITVQRSFLLENTDFQTENKENDFNIIGQFKNTYILLEKQDELWVIDQHIAHERYIYETLLEKASKNEIASQLFFTSIETSLEPTEIALLEENKELLLKYGYDFEINEKSVSLKQVPQILSGKNPENIIHDILESIKTGENKEDEVLITTSCKAAVKAGEKLSHWQMKELIEQWQTTKHPETCPHGRPILKKIEEKEIAKFFNRTVKTI